MRGCNLPFGVEITLHRADGDTIYPLPRLRFLPLRQPAPI